MLKDLDKNYSPTKIEADIYKFWEKNGYFSPDVQEKLGLVDRNKENFCITIPPPNVTGVLHIGHALTSFIQDFMIRFARMNGKKALYLPGADHAGIATQNVVERELKKKGIDRKEIGRKAFIEEIWKWKENSLAEINSQLKKMGASFDWTRERFTLSKGLSKAVRKAFFTLYNKDLIYKGKYLINWCSGRCESAISALEAESHPEVGKLYTIKYPVVSGGWLKPLNDWASGEWAKGAKDFIKIATTRPETILGDSAVAIPKEESKWDKFHKNNVVIPYVNRIVPIIKSKLVNAEFGTGALKITPAHDFNDDEIGKNNNLPRYSVLDKKARIVDKYTLYKGMSSLEARKAILNDIKKEGLLVKVEEHSYNVPRCQRCETIVQPIDSTQWFVKIKPLAENVLKQIEIEKTNFIPKIQKERLKQWINPDTIKDWCISRQLWWGHRIPVWYCSDCKKSFASLTDPESCKNCESLEIKQDPDVLDTWFSSGLWPFSTMGWPDKTKDFDEYYPNTMRETGYDILFFWIAREMMLGLELTGKLPYKNIYLHGLIRAKSGKKVSKSMEDIESYNPIQFINNYGSDPLRYTLLSYSTPGLDMVLDKENIISSHKFANKIWQASKFVLSKFESSFEYQAPVLDKNSSVVDKWIISQVNELMKNVKALIEAYDYLEASRELKRFFWNDYADWYLEASKIMIFKLEKSESTINILLYCLINFLKLTHPFMPFLTEAIWQFLPKSCKDHPAIIIARWPESNPKLIDNNSLDSFNLITEIISEVRKVRADYRLPFSKSLKVYINNKEFNQLISKEEKIITGLSKINSEDLILSNDIEFTGKGVKKILRKGFIFIPLENLIDLDEEALKLKKSIAVVEKQIESINKQLSPHFISRAPEEVVARTRGKLNDAKRELAHLKEKQANF